MPIITETWLTTITASNDTSLGQSIPSSSSVNHESITATTSQTVNPIITPTSQTTVLASDPDPVSSWSIVYQSTSTTRTLKVTPFLPESLIQSSNGDPTAAFEPFTPWDREIGAVDIERPINDVLSITLGAEGPIFSSQSYTSRSSSVTGRPLHVRRAEKSHSRCHIPHTIQQGETCDSISRDNGIPLNQLMIANPVLKGQCDEPPAGEVICIPSPLFHIRSENLTVTCNTRLPEVLGNVSCETVAAAARGHNITLNELMRLNPDLSFRTLGNCTAAINQSLCIDGTAGLLNVSGKSPAEILGLPVPALGVTTITAEATIQGKVSSTTGTTSRATTVHRTSSTSSDILKVIPISKTW
ncbi:hypothetical protein F4779DRAFT_634969 [Xylariaceae sp. FL0662B]|nr:hypothetical protein F4779DRAFT_634969 [Xylariaceae sp. FL0662B]